MKKLSKKELEIMELFWKNGAMTTNEVRELMPEPKPHINTISTQVRMLESNGFLDHRKDYNETFNGNPETKCLDNSYIKHVSALVKDDKITVDELRELINLIDSEN